MIDITERVKGENRKQLNENPFSLVQKNIQQSINDYGI